MARKIVQRLKYRKGSEPFDADELSRVLEEAYLLQRREAKHTQKFSFSPSTIGYGHGTCPRYWNIAFTGGWYEDVVDASGIANMANGSAAHERIQRVFKDAGILVAEEVEVKLADPPVRGFVDVLIKWEGETIVGEIKTANETSFMLRQSAMKPSANHLFQILIYLKATGKKTGFLLYENKNTQGFLVIPVEFNEENQEILENALNWMREVRKAWEDKELPLRPFTRRSKQCKGCPFWDDCWNKLDDGTISISPMEVPK